MVTREGSQYLDGGKLREQLAGKMTRTALAGAVGVNRSSVTRWISGTDCCQLETVARIATALDCDMRDLMRPEGIAALARITEAVKAA